MGIKWKVRVSGAVIGRGTADSGSVIPPRSDQSHHPPFPELIHTYNSFDQGLGRALCQIQEFGGPFHGPRFEKKQLEGHYPFTESNTAA